MSDKQFEVLIRAIQLMTIQVATPVLSLLVALTGKTDTADKALKIIYEQQKSFNKDELEWALSKDEVVQ